MTAPVPQSRLLRGILYTSIAVAVAVAMRRLIVLLDGSGSTLSESQSGPSPMANLEGAFASRAALTLSHIVPAMFFALLLPYILLRPSCPGWVRNAFYGLGAIVAVTAYALSADAFGGRIEQAAVLVFDTLFLASLTQAFVYHRRGSPGEEKHWLWRATWVLLGIATARPVMGVFFATSSRTHLQPWQFFGIAFWIGFSINAIAGEIWLWSQSRKVQADGLTAGLVFRSENDRQ